MKVTRIDGYHKHGCNFTGKLAVIDYSQELDYHPRRGQFGGTSFADVAEEAEKLAKKRYPGCEVLLNVPELVVRIE